MSALISDGNHGLWIALGGGSNVKGTGTGSPPYTKPSNLTYWSTKTGSLVNTAAWPNDFGLAVGLAQELSDRGFTSNYGIVEHGVAGSAISTWASTYAAELIAHCATVGVRPGVVCLYVGSVDADSGALAAASRTNIQTAVERFRTAWGAGVAVLLGGLHVPEAGVTSDLNLVDANLLDFALDHGANLAAYFSNRDLAIQGGGSDHLTGGATGGSVTGGRRFGSRLFSSGILV